MPFDGAISAVQSDSLNLAIVRENCLSTIAKLISGIVSRNMNAFGRTLEFDGVHSRKTLAFNDDFRRLLDSLRGMHCKPLHSGALTA